MKRNIAIVIAAIALLALGGAVGYVIPRGVDDRVATLSSGQPNPFSNPQVSPGNPTPIPTPTPIALVNIVIAVQELPRGFRIPRNAVTIRPFPEEAVPFNAVLNLDDVANKIARTDIFREQPILSNMLVDDFENLANDLARVGSDVSAVLPDTLVAVTIHVPAENVAKGTAPGDRINLIYTIPLTPVPSLAIQNGGTPVPVQSAQLNQVTQRTVQDALVIYLGEIPDRFIGIPPTPTPVPVEEERSDGFFGSGGSGPPPPTSLPPVFTGGVIPLTLGVTNQDANMIIWAQESGIPVSVVLRSATDTSRTPTDPITLDYIMQEYRIR